MDKVVGLCRENRCIIVDLRESVERIKDGSIPDSVNAPYGNFDDFMCEGGFLRELVNKVSLKLVFYCAYGERSTLAVHRSINMGFKDVYHLIGGVKSWKSEGQKTI